MKGRFDPNKGVWGEIPKSKIEREEEMAVAGPSGPEQSQRERLLKEIEEIKQKLNGSNVPVKEAHELWQRKKEIDRLLGIEEAKREKHIPGGNYI